MSNRFTPWLLVAGSVVLLLASIAYANRDRSSSTTSSTSSFLEVANQSMVIGDKDAPVKMVEYADPLCPYCAKFSNEVKPELIKNYINTGKVRLEYRPMAYLAADSTKASEGMFCAAEQNKFWEFHDLAYQKTWSDFYSQNKGPSEVDLFRAGKINSLAEEAGLSIGEFTDCMTSGKYTNEVQQQSSKAQAMGITGTPKFYINDQEYTGFAPYSVVKATIESQL